VAGTRQIRMAVAAVGAALAVTAGTLSALGPASGEASSHREAPLISADPQVDTTDVYAFRSPDNPETVTLVASVLPFQEPAGGPNFYAFDNKATYDLLIDNNGNARPDIIFRFDFSDHYRTQNTFLYNTGPVTSLQDPDLTFFQTYDLYRITVRGTGPNARTKTKRMINDAPVVPSNVGDASMPNFEADLFQPAATAFADATSRAWAGQSDDAFYLDLRVFDLLYGGDFSEAGDETLAGFNVNTLAIQVPRTAVARKHNVEANPIIGVWATSSRRSTRIVTDKGRERFRGVPVSVSRLGMPLVNEVVIPVGDKDLWNASVPRDDAQFLSYVTHPELPKLIQAVYGIPAPAEPRNDLVQVFLTGVPGLNMPAGVRPAEMIRLNMTTPVCEPPACGQYSRLGVIGGDAAGYPNGRRLADDVIDISLQVVEGELAGSPNDLGDGVDANPEGFRSTFPYVQVPTAGSDPDPH